MFRRLDCRAGHYGLLFIAWAALCLPNLGGPSLWDIDEGNNSEAAREMWRAGNWIVPTCNYKLREDKPALLYWLQAAGFSVFGAGEFAARLPSALAALAALLATYELGHRMFNPAAGLLAGLLLGASTLFCAAAHFANPDSLLNLCSLGALFFFWRDYAAGRAGWSRWSAAAAGLGVLAKGPVGLVLPAAVVCVFLTWRWQLGRLWSRRLLNSLLVFLLVAAPWYIWVTVETKGAWTVGFWMHHNQGRFLEAMESHTGPFYYYALILIAGCAPWSVFFGPTAWYTLRQVWRTKAQAAENPSHLSPLLRGEAPGDRGELLPSPLGEEGLGVRGDAFGGHSPSPQPLSPEGRGASVTDSPSAPIDTRPALQFLLCWIAVYFVFFSAASTKLPNYILPLYPAVALLTARFLDQWRRGEVNPPAWLIGASLACLALIGVGAAVGLLAAGGAIAFPGLHVRSMPALQWYAPLGLPLVLGAAAAAWLLLRRTSRLPALGAVLASSLLFTALLAGCGAGAVETWKAPKALALALPPDQTRRDVRVATFAYFQPSLIFYCQREVTCFYSEPEAAAFLQGPLPSYLFIPADQWQSLKVKAPGAHQVFGPRRDLYGNVDVVVVTND